MNFNCFNCGAPLPIGSLKCKACGFSPDIEFMKKCPDLRMGICHFTKKFCNWKEPYQLCPVKNTGESECDF